MCVVCACVSELVWSFIFTVIVETNNNVKEITFIQKNIKSFYMSMCNKYSQDYISKWGVITNLVADAPHMHNENFRCVYTLTSCASRIATYFHQKLIEDAQRNFLFLWINVHQFFYETAVVFNDVVGFVFKNLSLKSTTFWYYFSFVL